MNETIKDLKGQVDILLRKIVEAARQPFMLEGHMIRIDSSSRPCLVTAYVDGVNVGEILRGYGTAGYLVDEICDAAGVTDLDTIDDVLDRVNATFGT